MKKITFLTVALLFSVCLFAQQSAVHMAKNKAMTATKAKLPGTQDTKAIIWQDDLSVPANWTTTNDVGNTDNWVIGTGIPSGLYPIGGIASTTAANGFALFDSDLLCSGNQIANLTTATSIDCSGHPNIQLQFEEMYRRWFDSTYVYVSTNGTTWTAFPVNASYIDNDMTPNPTTIGVNISSVAGNQATVWIRFTFWSPSTYDATNAGCGYAWMIDDVLLQDLVANDVMANQTFLDFNQFSSYAAVPFNQMGVITYGISATNNGSSPLTNVTLNVDINAGGITGTSAALATMASGEIDTLAAQPTFATPSTLTAYEAKLWITQTETDVNPENNIGDSITFYATPDEFQRSLNLDSYLSPYSFGTFAPAITDMEYGANYLFVNATVVDSIEVLVYGATDGTSITGKLYTADMATAARTLVGQSASYSLTPGSLPGVIKLGLTSPYNVAIGTTLTATVAMTVDIAGLDTIKIGADGSFIGDSYFGGAAYLNDGSAWGWYYVNGTVPIVGLIIDTEVGIQESDNNQSSIYPNPANNQLNINNANGKVTMINAVGQIVFENNVTTKAYSINTSNFEKGVYLLQIENESGVSTKKVIINR